MPYIVQIVNHLYDNPDTGNDEDVQEWLNEKEAEGFTLVGILPNHQTWDENKQPQGLIDAMLIVHKPADEPKRGGRASFS